MSLKYHLLNIPYEIEVEFVQAFYKLFRRRPSSRPFISSDSFRAISDVRYEDGHPCTAADINSCEKKPPVVFVQAKFLCEFIDAVLPQIVTPFILISHGSPTNITESPAYRSLLDSPFLVRWFAKNGMIDHPKLTAVPIGLENRCHHRSGAIGDFKRKSYTEHKKIPKILFGFTLGTNPQSRVPCYLALCDKENTEQIPLPPNAHLYRKLLRNYMFVASPDGKGVDCHRTWEALYMNVVPIVEDNALNRTWEKLGLPMWLVRDWNSVTRLTSEELSEKYRQIMQKAKTDALWFGYWEEKIAKAGGR